MSQVYKILDLKQGSEGWLAVRNEKIGASDSGSIMGLNPYKSAAALWKEKVCAKKTFCNANMQRGKDLEPQARSWFERQKGVTLSTPVLESIDRPWQIASLDGFCAQKKIVVEIKCGSEKLHDMSKKGEIPEYYMAQMQHQLSVTGFEKAFYCSYNGSEGIIVEVLRDDSFIEKMNSLEEAFWVSMVNLEQPKPDFEVIETQEAVNLLRCILERQELVKSLDVQIRLDKEKLFSMNGGNPFIVSGKKVYPSTTTSYDTKAMTADGIDISKYKKVSNPFWRIS